MNTISLADLASKLQSPTPPLLVEALPSNYFQQGHLPGAVNINIGETATKAPSLLPAKDSEVVVYCASTTCTNSDQVAGQLQMLGYHKVSVFKGGKAEWQAAGYVLQSAAA